MMDKYMVRLTKVTREAWPDVYDGTSGWTRGATALEILRPIETETVYVNPDDVILVEPKVILVGWDEERVPRDCRNVGREQPWWTWGEGSAVHVRQAGKMTVTEAPEEVHWNVQRAWNG